MVSPQDNQTPVTTPINHAMTTREWTLLFALASVWAASFFFNAVILAELPPMTTVTLRVGIAALILLAAMPIIGQRLPMGAAVWRAFLVMGLLNNLVPY